MLPPIMGKRTQTVYNTLLQEIENGILKAGTRLPTEKEMCLRFKVGRNTVRQAMARLAKERRVYARRGSGTYVLAASKRSAATNIISLMCHAITPLLVNLQHTALRRGCLLHFYLHSQQHWNVDAEKLFLEHILKARHKALLAMCSPHAPRNDRLLQDLVNEGVRVIHFAPHRLELPNEEYIMPDYRRAGYKGAIALMLAGYDDLFFVRLATDGPYAILQENGFAEALQEYGYNYNPERQLIKLDLTWHGDNTVLEPLRQALSNGRTAGIYCRDAKMASSFHALFERWQVKTPSHAGLIGPLVDPLIGKEEQLPPGVDILRFPPERLIPQALDIVLEDRQGPIRELVPAEWQQQGAVRINRNSLVLAQKGCSVNG